MDFDYFDSDATGFTAAAGEPTSASSTGGREFRPVAPGPLRTIESFIDHVEQRLRFDGDWSVIDANTETRSHLNFARGSEDGR